MAQTQLQTVVVANMQTTERFFDHFEVEVWDSAQKNRILGPYSLKGKTGQNLFLWSQELENGAWITDFAGNIVITTDNQASPDGTPTADLLTFASPGANLYQTVGANAPSAGTKVTVSVWLKTNSSTAQLNLFVNRVGGDTEFSPLFTVTTTWQRFSFTHTGIWTGISAMQAGIDSRFGTVAAVVAAWGFQLEVAPAVGPYLETMTVASLGNWVQQEPLYVRGLTLGATYDFRARVQIKSGGQPSPWTAFVPLTVGDADAPTGNYAPTALVTASGVVVQSTPTSLEADFNHFEFYASTVAPSSSTAPNLPNSTDGAVRLVLADTDILGLYIRAVDTSGNRQAWTSLGNYTSNGALVSGSALGILSDNLCKNGDFTQQDASGHTAFNWTTGVTSTSNIVYGTNASLPRGNTFFSVGAVQATLESNEFIPVDTAKTYFVEGWIRITGGTGPLMYGGFKDYDGGKAFLAHDPTGANQGYTLFAAITSTVGGTYQYFSGEVTGEALHAGPNQFASGCKYIRLAFLLNWGGTPATQVVILGVRFSEVAAGHHRAMNSIDAGFIAIPGAVDFARAYTGKQTDNIPDGTYSLRTYQYQGGVVTIDNADFEASASLVDNAPPGWGRDSANTTASYETSTQQSGNQSLKCVFAATFGNVFTLRKYKVIPGELYRISGFMKSLSGVNGQIQAWFGDSSGTFVAQAIAQSTSAAWIFVSGTGTVPVNAVYMVIRLGTAGGVTGTVWYDNIHVVRAATAFEVTPINTSGHATVGGGALTQSGGSSLINVASKIIQYGDGQVTYSAGSKDPGVLGTWYIYADDPGYGGGAVTYLASANEFDVYGANGRVFFGKITTVGGGGGASTSPPGSGGGKFNL